MVENQPPQTAGSNKLPQLDEGSERTRGGTGGANRASNIVIDIESEDLTFNQARQIRLQIEKDVEQLRNRVRMLKQEEARAMKKIKQTKDKTKQFLELQQKNDDDFRNKMNQAEYQRMNHENRSMNNFEKHNKQMRDVRIRTNQHHNEKMKSVNDFRNHKNQLRNAYLEQKNQHMYKASEQRQNIQIGKQMGAVRQNEFMMKKCFEARREQNDKAIDMQGDINNYENEAQDLERMEADLLVKLQQTQKQEREAFVKLESAMVDASIPKNVRKMAGTSFTGKDSDIRNSTQQ